MTFFSVVLGREKRRGGGEVRGMESEKERERERKREGERQKLYIRQ